MYGSRAPEGALYYCRGCGGQLPPDWHGQFHPECLKTDKRRRTQEKRRLEYERFQLWLAHQKCPACGSAMSQEVKQSDREPSPAAHDSSGPVWVGGKASGLRAPQLRWSTPTNLLCD